MAFGWDDAAIIGANAVQGAISGNKDQPLGNLHLVNPAQQALYNTMARNLLTGSGDFGGGRAFKQGYSNLSDMMAQRGINPESGIAMQQVGNLAAQSGAIDAQNRRNTWFQLMSQPLQTATVAGANYIPGSPSTGATTDVQARNYDRKGRNRYGGSLYDWGE